VENVYNLIKCDSNFSIEPITDDMKQLLTKTPLILNSFPGCIITNGINHYLSLDLLCLFSDYNWASINGVLYYCADDKCYFTPNVQRKYLMKPNFKLGAYLNDKMDIWEFKNIFLKINDSPKISDEYYAIVGNLSLTKELECMYMTSDSKSPIVDTIYSDVANLTLVCNNNNNNNIFDSMILVADRNLTIPNVYLLPDIGINTISQMITFAMWLVLSFGLALHSLINCMNCNQSIEEVYPRCKKRYSLHEELTNEEEIKLHSMPVASTTAATSLPIIRDSSFRMNKEK
jgi:hypothetical protein